jgi:predicted Zn finger-like uncharacterized protein
MTLVTRCPQCNTLFRVTPEQLRARQGAVRCGRCSAVFDALGTLSTLPDEAAPQAPAHDAAPARAASASPPVPPPASESHAQPRTPAPERAPVRLGSEDPLLAPQPRGRSRLSSRWWAAALALAALALAAQALFHVRGLLAARVPSLRAPLVELCGWLGCSVSLPQRPRQIAIEATELAALDPAQPGRIQLTATLRNHAGHDVGYPALDLVLTSARDHTLARRVFLPHEYLEPGRDPAAGIPADAEVTVRLELDTGDLGAAGFRLDLLPAP